MSCKEMNLELLKQLCLANGVSGYEGGVADIIVKFIKDNCDAVMKDAVGNILAYKKGETRGNEKIMLCAHMDEVGFAVKNINDDGTLDFCEVGMVSSVLPSKRVTVGNKNIPGVVSARPVHLIKDRKKACDYSDLVIDIGAKNKEDAEKYVKIGDFAAFDTDFALLRESLVKAKALDDRIGCAIMCMLTKEKLRQDIYFAFTVGEELGGVGASAATNRIHPDKCFVLEGTTASDLAGTEGKDKVCTVGGGAVCPFMDGGTMYNHEMYTGIHEFAKAKGIAIQTKTKVAGGTDASKIQKCFDGVQIAAISLPCRYIHTSASVASKKDMDAMYSLVCGMLAAE